MVRVFPISTNANEHVVLALGFDCTGRDNVEICRGRGQSMCSCRFICVKAHETNVPRMLYSMLEVHSSMSAKSLRATDTFMQSVSCGASICSASVDICVLVYENVYNESFLRFEKRALKNA